MFAHFLDKIKGLMVHADELQQLIKHISCQANQVLTDMLWNITHSKIHPWWLVTRLSPLRLSKVHLMQVWAIKRFRRTSVAAPHTFYPIWGHGIPTFPSSSVPTIRPLLPGCLLKPLTSGCSGTPDESRQTWMWTNSYNHGAVIQVKQLLVRLQ